MDTKPLERFAAWARRELINAVDAQATAVLAVGSVARSERAEVIKKLEAEIARHGRQQVVDKVAYIWFNRIIALRFMDARGYTDAAVVSPARGQAHGQPEILADAKRGNLDTDVVTKSRTANAIIGLLDGTRRSTDAEGEAYALLLTEYCRFWHKPMPFMFEREGDFTELLVPANLLADDSILAQAREVLTEDVCGDVEIIGWLYQFYISERKSEVFAGFKKNKRAGADEIPAATQLFTPHWIVRYLVENSLGRLWMLNRPSSRLVDQMAYYVAPIDEESDFLKIAKPEELKIIDPACGSGHMLTYAFDLLYAIYEEEGYAPSEIPSLIIANNLYGTEIDPRAGALAAFALMIKAREMQRTFFNKKVKPHICVIEPISIGSDGLDFLATSDGNRNAEDAFWNQFAKADIFGSLIQPDPHVTAQLRLHLDTLDDGGELLKADVIKWARRAVMQAEYLLPQYSVVVANPPYMGSGNMGPVLGAFVNDKFPLSKADLFAAFIERNITLLVPNGATAMITMQAWMYLASFSKLRQRIVHAFQLSSMAHLGARAFDSIGGEIVSTTAFVVWNRPAHAKSSGMFLRLTGGANEDQKSHALRMAARGDTGLLYVVRLKDLLALPGAPIAYQAESKTLEIFRTSSSVGDVSSTRKGMATGLNREFVREWWEVSWRGIGFGHTRKTAAESNLKWFPYASGGEYRKWYGNATSIVNWQYDGARLQSERNAEGRVRAVNLNLEYIFTEGISWTSISSGALSVRLLPQGSLFSSASNALFASQGHIEIMGLLNSDAGGALLKLLNPTLNANPGDIGRVPFVPSLRLLRDPVARAVALTKADYDSNETSFGFLTNAIQNVDSGSSLEGRFQALWREWDVRTEEVRSLEVGINQVVGDAFGLGDDSVAARRDLISLTRNRDFVYRGADQDLRDLSARAADAADLISYAVGCMFGRYSLDKPGLILADQGHTLQDYLAEFPTPSFKPDLDNVIPIVDGDWFDDDVFERFRQFLRAAFGEEHFEENLRFVEESLGVKTLRDYFISKAGKSKFYDDHVQRYKKRPIYWMFSSPNGSFNALIYMHRYTPSTASTVLNEYLREYRAKLEVALANAEQAAAGGGSVKEQKEADRLRKVLAELRDYEHDVLYPLATQQIVIDLDDGVKANYPKFYPALKKIAGLEAAE